MGYYRSLLRSYLGENLKAKPTRLRQRLRRGKPNPTESDRIRLNPTFEIRIARASFFAFVFLVQWLMTEMRSKTPGRESKSVKVSAAREIGPIGRMRPMMVYRETAVHRGSQIKSDQIRPKMSREGAIRLR